MGEEYLLKERSNQLSPAMFQSHLKLHRFAEQRQAPVAHLFETTRGSLYAMIDLRAFELQSFLASAVPPTTAADARSAGDALATFLRAVAEFRDWPFGRWDVPVDRPRRLADRWEWLFPYVRHLSKEAEGRTPLVADLVAALHDVGDQVDRSSVPAQMIHGDAHPVNMMVTPSGRTYLVDLDEARYGHRLWDIAHAIAGIGAIEMGSTRSGERDEVRGAWQTDLVKSFLAGVQAELALSPSEFAALPATLAAATVIAAIEDLDYDIQAADADESAVVTQRLIVLITAIPSLL
jgi:Ser/Thr protein kinase RdoA (MazF antagonist)